MKTEASASLVNWRSSEASGVESQRVSVLTSPGLKDMQSSAEPVKNERAC